MVYFFKGKLEKGKVTIYPLEKQGLDTNLKVSCSKSIRKSDESTIYYCHYITNVGEKYYKAAHMRVFTDDSPTEVKTYYTKLKENLEKDLDKEKLRAAEEAEKERKVDTFYSKLITDEKMKAPTSTEDGFYMQTNDWNILARNIKKHVNTLILGPAGTGKTSCIKILCERLGIDLHVFDMGSMLDPVSSLLGVHRLEKGESIFDYAKFTKVIQEPCVILLDELSRAPQTAMNILFPCLDDRRSLSVEIACGNGVRDIKIHPEVTFVATANIGVEYSGTNSMDRALVNRFFPLELGYIPNKEEECVLKTRTKIATDTAEIIVKIANNIRSLAKKQEISNCPSIRESLMVADLVSDGWSISDAMQSVYLPLYEGSKTEGERGTVYKILTSY